MIINVLFLKLNTTAKILESALVLCFISFSRSPRVPLYRILSRHYYDFPSRPSVVTLTSFLVFCWVARNHVVLSDLVVLLVWTCGSVSQLSWLWPFEASAPWLTPSKPLSSTHTYTPSASAQLPFRYRSNLLMISPSVGIFQFLSFHPQWSDTHQRNVTDLPSVLLKIQGNLRKSLSNHQVEVDGSRHMGRR